jgi:hypothetical protein
VLADSLAILNEVFVAFSFLQSLLTNAGKKVFTLVQAQALYRPYGPQRE